MISKERPSTAGMTTGSASGKLFETFSKEHREKLAIGATTGAWSSTVKAKRSKARITVVIRKRPLTQAEAARNETDILKPAPSSKTTMKIEEPRKNVCGVPYIEMHTFTFDRAYSDKHTNKDIYRSCVRQLVDTVFTQGARCSCFTYGQTGSGKTYTMCGPERMGSQSQTLLENQGILEMAAHDCFKWLHQPEFDYHFGLYVSFFEIYCNKVYDLLGDRRVVKALETKTSDGVVVKDLTTVKVDGVDTLVQTMNSGLDLRVVGSNSKNTDSSRGHAVLTLEVRNEHTQTNFGKLAFIDLAGSERGADAMFSGKLTQTDGAGINRSLLALKECIRALDQQSSHVPFRDSELTKVLRDMFIGNKARTLMISCVAPSSGCCEQTLNTLRYTERVKAIRRNCQPDVETTDEEEAAQTGRESEVGDEGKGRSRRVRGTRSNEQTRKVDQTRDDNTETKSCGRKRVKDSSETRCESHKRPVQRSSSRSIDGSEYLTDSGSSLSSMLSLGTSHASDDRQRMMSSGSDEDGAPPLSARRNEDQLNIGICHMPRVINQTRDDDITASEDGDVLSPRARIASAALSLNRNAKLSRGSDARLTASCFDPNIGSPSPVATRLGTTDINHDSVLRSSLNRPRPLSGTLTSENRGLAPTLIGDRPSSQQLTVAATPRRSNLSFLPQRSFQLGNAKGRTSSLVREQPLGGSTKALAEMASRQVPLRDVQSQQPSTDHDETRTTIPLSFTTHRENGRSEIAKFFPQPESDDVLAAANILRKRYREFEFPVPPKSSPSDGKHVEALTAIEMLDELLIMPAKEIHTFYDQYTYKIQQFYADLVQAHMDCLKAHTCSGMTQQKMLKEIYSSHDQQFDISSQYLSNLRSTLENQLLIQFRLAKRLGEMERMLALQRTIGKGFQAASASEVEYYPFNPPVNSSQDSSNASSSVVHSSTEPASARLSSKIGGGIRNVSPLNQLTQSLNSGNHHTSNIHGSNRTAPGAGERTAASTAASTTATSTGTASLRSIREYSPMVTPYVERRESIAKPRTASTEASSGCNIDIVNSNIRITPGNNDSRPLQPPTALSLEGPVRIPTNATTVVRRRDLREPPIGSDGFPIPNDIGHRSTATMSTTYSARRARRSRKAPFTELGQEGATRTGELSSEGFEQAMAARSKRPTRQAACVFMEFHRCTSIAAVTAFGKREMLLKTSLPFQTFKANGTSHTVNRALFSTSTLRKPWERELTVQESENRFLLSEENIIKTKCWKKEADQSSLQEFLRHAGPNDFQISCSVMNLIYNSGIPLSNKQLPSNVLGLCIQHNWLDEALDFIRFHQDWFRYSLNLNEYLLLMARFSQRNDIAGVMTIFGAARTNWQVALDGRLYDTAFMLRLVCALAPDCNKDKSTQPRTQPPVSEEALKRNEWVEKSLKSKREKAESRVMIMFGESLPSTGSVSDLFCDLLMIYSDGVELGVRLSLEIHQLMMDEVLTQLTPHLKALQQNWDEVINQMAVQSDCNKPTKIAIKFLNHIKNDEYMKDSLLSVRLLHTAMSIHNQLLRDYPFFQSSVTEPDRFRCHYSLTFNQHTFPPESLVMILRQFYSILQEVPLPLRQFVAVSAASHIPQCQYRSTERLNKQPTHQVSSLETTEGLQSAFASIAAHSLIS